MEAATDSGSWDLTIWATAGAICLLLAMSAFFSGSETALTAASRPKLHAQAEKGSRGAATALRLTEDSESLIGAILLGNNLVNILATSLATSLFTVLFGQSGVALATLIMTLLVLVFSEVTPKTYAITNAEVAATRVAPVLQVVVRLLSPIVHAIRALVRVMLWTFGVRADADARIMAREEIAGAIALHHSEGLVQKDDRDRLMGALDLASRTVDEVMIHRSQILTLDANADPGELISDIISCPFTRIPVWKDNPENIVGVIHSKDLLREVHRLSLLSEDHAENLHKFDLTSVMMEPWFVPDATTLDDQMRAFLRRHSHFALVVDEYGDLQGLITLEDILEEIVGDITDEHDEEAGGMVRDEDGAVTVDGTMSIRDINRALDWSLPDDEANTIAGLVIHEAQTIPTEGQVFSFHGFRFEVMERERNQIRRLRIKRL